jgi:hypothetical protein
VILLINDKTLGGKVSEKFQKFPKSFPKVSQKFPKSFPKVSNYCDFVNK